MRIKRTFTFIAVIVAILFLSIGYAAISNITLTVTGTATTSTSDADFSVAYVTGTNPTLSGGATAAAYSNGTAATMSVALSSGNPNGSAIFTIKNNSATLNALLTPTVSNNFVSQYQDYLEVNQNAIYSDAACTTPLSGSLAAGGTAYLKVNVHLKKAPLADITDGTFTVTVTAAPTES